MDFITASVNLNWIGKLIYNHLYGWIKNWNSSFEVIGAFAVTVIMFTLFLKIVTLPLDFWQKATGRKNALKSELMKPEIDKITRQCGDNRELLMQKQREVHKKYKYSAFSACLPALLTMAIFFTIFSGFNNAVKYHNFTVFEQLNDVYNQAYAEKAMLLANDNEKTQLAIEQEATSYAEAAVLAEYKPESFLFTTNIFMPDTWKNPIPTDKEFFGTGMGKLNISVDDVNPAAYDRVMKPIINKYNIENGKKQWNGYLVLPIIAFILSILSSKLIKPPEQPPMAGQTEEQAKMAKSQAKMMQYMMPLMMGVFSLFYSSAFALYMVISNVFTTAFNLIYNSIAKKIDAKKRDIMLSTTIKK